MTKYLPLVGLLLLAFWLRLDELDIRPPGLSNDEAVNSVDSFHLARTGNFPIYDDPNPPEPLHRILLAFNLLFFGTSVWAFRLTSVFAGILTIAAAYWATSEALRDVRPQTRHIAALTASSALTVAAGHVTVSRIVERGVLQPLLMLLLMGFLLRGLRTAKYRAFVLAGVTLGLLIYTYTAALIMPAIFVPLGLSLLAFSRKTWRNWLPQLAATGMVFALLALPVGVRILDTPTAVLGRAGDVRAGSINLGSAISAMWKQFMTAGDENPQYNADSAPLLPPSSKLLFVVGLTALVLRIRQPSSAMIAAYLVFAAVPVIASNEITHGLRIVGEYAAFPLVIGVGIASILTIFSQLSSLQLLSIVSQYRAAILAWLHLLIFVGLVIFTLRDASSAHQIYVEFWDKPYKWSIHERSLQHGEWFYRTDRRDLARWIASQDTPLLVPLDELNTQTMRTWLMPAYPDIPVSGDTIQIPEDTRLVVTWSLELHDLRRETRQYVLLQNGRVTILPPFSTQTHRALLEGIDEAEAVERDNGTIDLVARVKGIPDDIEISFEPHTMTGNPLGIFGDKELQLQGWWGPDSLLSSGEQTLTYILEWQGLIRIGHKYSAFLQLLTQDYQRIAGDDVRMLEWLYPTSVWRTGDIVPDTHTLTISGSLAPGAYRLVAGIYPFVTPDRRLPVFAPTGEPIGDSLTIGWLKVPQREAPEMGEDSIQVDAAIGDFVLRGAKVTRVEGSKIRVSLFWETAVERPDIDATIFVHVVDETGANVTQQDSRPQGGQYPTFIWSKGELVQTNYTLDIGGADFTQLSLKVGMYALPSVDRFPVVQDRKSVPDGRVDLGKVELLLQE